MQDYDNQDEISITVKKTNQDKKEYRVLKIKKTSIYFDIAKMKQDNLEQKNSVRFLKGLSWVYIIGGLAIITQAVVNYGLTGALDLQECFLGATLALANKSSLEVYKILSKHLEHSNDVIDELLYKVNDDSIESKLISEQTEDSERKK